MMGTSKTTGFSTSLKGWEVLFSRKFQDWHLRGNKTPKQQNFPCVTCPSLVTSSGPWESLCGPELCRTQDMLAASPWASPNAGIQFCLVAGEVIDWF